MTYRVTTDDDGRRLVLVIDENTHAEDIERAVRAVYRWHRKRVAATGRELQELQWTRETFCAWCWRQHKNGQTAPKIAKAVNAAIAELVEDFVRRIRPVEAAVLGEIGTQSMDLFALTTAWSIDAGRAIKRAEQLLIVARPRTTPTEMQDQFLTAIERIRQGQSAFLHPLLPVDPESIERAIELVKRPPRRML